MLRSAMTLLAALTVVAEALKVSVGSGSGKVVSPLQYGAMFEDINHSGDGGIYAELIQNRAFQGNTTMPSNLNAWSSVGGTTLSLKNLTTPLSVYLPTSMNVATTSHSGKVGVKNSGWWGMDVKVKKYTGSFWVHGSYYGNFYASFVSNTNGKTYGSTTISSNRPSTTSEGGWRQYNYTLMPSQNAPNANNSFVLTFDASRAKGSLDFQIISLFPPTYKNRPNGMRVDLMEAMGALNPSFLRMPGGNNIEGNVSPFHWYWNQTIGPLQNRPGRPGTWGYFNTDGLGLIEYLWWCQDLGMEPILALWDGLYLDGETVTNASMPEVVQSALDELEFLMGDASTQYGAMRIQLGYPEPFQINYVEIGNEDNLSNGLATYQAYRLQDFYNAIRAKYPNMTIMASTSPADLNGNGNHQPLPGNAVQDFHEYDRPDDFVSQFHLFDSDNWTTEHKTLIGEYATIEGNVAGGGPVDWSGATPRLEFPFWIGSVAEAVFSIGSTERNTDKIIGMSYAPGFQNLNSAQWTPDLIAFDADQSHDVLSTSYYVIKLLSNNRMTKVLPVTNATYGPAYYVAGINEESGSHMLKTAIYNSTGDYPMTVSFDGIPAGASATLTVLTATSAAAMNTLSQPNVVQTKTTTLKADSKGVFSFSLPNLSVSVLEVAGGPSHYSRRSRIMPKGYKELTYKY